MSGVDIVPQGRASPAERLYCLLSGFTRRFVWSTGLRHPHTTFQKMGNVAIIVARDHFGALNPGTHHVFLTTPSLAHGAYEVRIVGGRRIFSAFLRIVH